MNLVEIQQALQGLPDDALVKEMQMPTGTAPQYMILSELQRRKAMRMQAAARMPTTTVRQDVAGFAEGGSVNEGYKTPGWLGGIGTMLTGGILAPSVLGAVADQDSGWFGAAPWLLRQLGFGSEEEKQPQAAGKPTAFAGGDHVISKEYEGMLTRREQDPKDKDRSVNAKSGAMGVFQIMPEVWNKTAAQHPEMKFQKVPAHPTKDQVPSLEEQKRMYAILAPQYRNSVINAGFSPNPANTYIAHWQGPGAGPRLIDYFTKHPQATNEDAFRYARPDAYRTVMAQNNIDPKGFLADTMRRVERDFGGYSVGARMDDKGIHVPTQSEYDANARWTIQNMDRIDPEGSYDGRNAPVLSSVPAGPPVYNKDNPMPSWLTEVPAQEPPLRPRIGPPITGTGIEGLLVSPKPGQAAPWKVIQHQSGIKGYAGGDEVQADEPRFLLPEQGNPFNFEDQSYGIPFPLQWWVNPDGTKPVHDFADKIYERVIDRPWGEENLYTALPRALMYPSAAIGYYGGHGAGGLGDLADAIYRNAGKPFKDWDTRATQAKAPTPTTASMTPAQKQSAYPVQKHQVRKPAASALGAGIGSASASASSTGSEANDALEEFLRNQAALNQRRHDAEIPRAQRNDERDKWLALGEFGARLAGGQSPYFAQNFGPAAAAGLASYRQSQSQYDEDLLKQAQLRLQEEQLNETAAGRRDTTALGLAQVEGNVRAAQIRSDAYRTKLSAKAAGISDADYSKLMDQAVKAASATGQGVPTNEQVLWWLNYLIQNRGKYGVIGGGGIGETGDTGGSGLNIGASGEYE